MTEIWNAEAFLSPSGSIDVAAQCLVISCMKLTKRALGISSRYMYILHITTIAGVCADGII